MKNCKVGDRIRMYDLKSVWEVAEASPGGLVIQLVNSGIVGPHKHFISWADLTKYEAVVS